MELIVLLTSITDFSGSGESAGQIQCRGEKGDIGQFHVFIHPFGCRFGRRVFWKN